MKNKKRKKPLAHNNVSIEQRIELSLQLARVIRGGPSLVNYFILQLEAEEREGARYTRVSRIRCNGDRKRVAITVSKVSRVVHARLSLLLEEDDARGFLPCSIRGENLRFSKAARFHTSSRVSIKVSLDLGRIVRICIYIYILKVKGKDEVLYCIAARFVYLFYNLSTFESIKRIIHFQIDQIVYI